MNELTFAYKPIAESTWAYLSSLLMIALFFKFNRFWSIRNFDLLLIVLLAPGILLISAGTQWQPTRDQNRPVVESLEQVTGPATIDEAIEQAERGVPSAVQGVQGQTAQDGALGPAPDPGVAQLDAGSEPIGISQRLTLGQKLQQWGYIWLFSVGAIFLIRMLLDPAFVRRPRLEPNLSIGGMVFLACSLMAFLFANIVTSQPTAEDLRSAQSAVKLLQREAAGAEEQSELAKRGPGHMLLNLIPIIPTFGNSKEKIQEIDPNEIKHLQKFVAAAKSLAILSQLLIVIGLVLIGSWHFQDFSVGVAMATIYLMLPYTAVFTGHGDHVLPGALLVWSVVFFRRPVVAGILIGLATGVSYYAIFLLPLWLSFYWEKGVRRFVLGAVIALGLCIPALMFTSSDPEQFVTQLRKMFGFWLPLMEDLDGIWGLGWDRWFRVPLLAAFIALCVSFVFWPVRKDIGVLISYTCAVMLAVQFWHGFGGGLYMAWYLPLALAAFFRPNTEGRVAMLELEKRKPKKESIEDLIPVQ